MPDHIAAGAKLDRWLTWIRHRLLLSGISLKSAGAKRRAANIRAPCRIPYRHIEGAEDIEGEHPTDAPSRMSSLGQGGDKQHAAHHHWRGDVESELDILQIPKHLGPLSRCRTCRSERSCAASVPARTIATWSRNAIDSMRSELRA